MVSPPYRVIATELHEIVIQLHEYVSEGQEVITCPVERRVCGMCRGLGSVVDPAIDASGLGEVDDYYRSGGYNVKCPRCRGKRVEEMPKIPAPFRKIVNDYLRDEMAYARLCASERAYGC